jgi:hypothetical protein
MIWVVRKKLAVAGPCLLVILLLKFDGGNLVHRLRPPSAIRVLFEQTVQTAKSILLAVGIIQSFSRPKEGVVRSVPTCLSVYVHRIFVSLQSEVGVCQP